MTEIWWKMLIHRPVKSQINSYPVFGVCEKKIKSTASGLKGFTLQVKIKTRQKIKSLQKHPYPELYVKYYTTDPKHTLCNSQRHCAFEFVGASVWIWWSPSVVFQMCVEYLSESFSVKVAHSGSSRTVLFSDPTHTAQCLKIYLCSSPAKSSILSPHTANFTKYI